VDAGNFDEISDWWSLEERPTAYYRTAAARARRLEAEATIIHSSFCSSSIAPIMRFRLKSPTPP
jgi:hypothetical protein